VIYHIPFEVYAQTVEVLKTSEQANQHLEISLILPNGERFAHTGKIVTGSNEFNHDTQMIDILAEFPNPTYLLRPGLSVTVQSKILPSQR
jgi:membrane fusion protein (multidrug efflux system)